MTDIAAALLFFRQQIAAIYAPHEAKAIAEISLQYITQYKRLQLYTHSKQLLSTEQIAQINHFIEQLLAGRPIQYIIGHTQFLGLTIACSAAALIPRPETEELVLWALAICKTYQNKSLSILDIGTGTGCIALALQQNLPQALIMGIDISPDAIALAQHNAQYLQLNTLFQQGDILQMSAQTNSHLPQYQLIISNPPYITEQEINSMAVHVHQHEPAIALFVPNHNPLLFYRAIALFALHHLANEGSLLVEINENYAQATAQLFTQMGFAHTEVRRDINGKERMVWARQTK